ncbi:MULTISPECIES: prepilin-type N-terminal cleavage/methylation domain-containing protein [Vibrio]|uniref:type IV pilus modification PilV family protein n=1 Tax=Vibrio TaxID=662 RepID=UPI002075386B|nr:MULTISPECIES: prepilin-type N-terminal cleavage/methylation domain-containing protein [unclassified Vibrio]MDK9778922.1 prepilin-type N-terminal cleavage/methylation domain-containing protein [Vibrio sp. D401a]MDK9800438.1 prepilin-type N-terminal cleavage/methylation domain-containing protein [Vibrio sp. D406a]USD49683.1 prepilin-type N-terminal cleavage/methylation domain-containing protein [Vibrio sp. SCSIO 43153]
MKRFPKEQLGMTLIEMIIAIVLLGIAMTIFSSALIPPIKEASSSHYQSRAVALGQSMMSQILSRNFDHNSDINGGWLRCGEEGAPDCSELKADTDDGESTPATFNDVDDYIGCWFTSETKVDCPAGMPQYALQDVIGLSANDTYKNFRVQVSVTEKTKDVNGEAIPKMRRVELQIFASNAQVMSLFGYRGNY